MAYSSLVIFSTFKKNTVQQEKKLKKKIPSLARKAVFVSRSFASLTLLFLIKYVIF